MACQSHTAANGKAETTAQAFGYSYFLPMRGGQRICRHQRKTGTGQDSSHLLVNIPNTSVPGLALSEGSGSAINTLQLLQDYDCPEKNAGGKGVINVVYFKFKKNFN